MTYGKDAAKPLLTTDEYELFCSSLPERIERLDSGELKQAIDRCRRARSKYRDLHQRQAGSTIEQTGARAQAGTANERTAEKVTIFAEALERLEQRRDQLTG